MQSLLSMVTNDCSWLLEYPIVVRSLYGAALGAISSGVLSTAISYKDSEEMDKESPFILRVLNRAIIMPGLYIKHTIFCALYSAFLFAFYPLPIMFGLFAIGRHFFEQ